MIKTLFAISALFATITPSYGNELPPIESEEEMTPAYLYKIVAPEQLESSTDTITLSEDDDEFIHFSSEDQLDRILSKYWANTPAIVLQVDTSKLPGDLVLEANPGGTTKYYHLYDGFIPLDAVVDSKVMN